MKASRIITENKVPVLVIVFSALLLGSMMSIGPVPVAEVSDVESPASVPEAAANENITGLWEFEGSYNNEIPGAPAIVPYGAVSLQSNGGVNYSGYLDITPTTNAYAEIPYNTSYDGTGITIELWLFAPYPLSQSMDILSKTNGTLNIYNYRLTIDTNMQLTLSYTGDSSGTDFQITAMNNSITPGIWHQVVIRLDAIEVELFIDGIYQGTTGPGEAPVSGNATITIGDPYVEEEIYIDHLVYYDGLLSEWEIEENFDRCVPHAVIYADNTEIYVGDSVYFDANDSYGGVQPYTYEWYFPDTDSYEYSENVEHLFNVTGEFNVSLKITDYAGMTSTDNITIYVSEPPIIDDDYEENDFLNEATYLDPYYASDYYGLYQYDDDYFRVYVNAGDALNISISVLDEYVYSIELWDIDPGDGTPIRMGDYDEYNNEIFLGFQPSPYDGEYLILINGSCTGVQYDIHLSVGYDESYWDDEFEENDFFEEATPIYLPFSFYGFSALDDDYYEIQSGGAPVHIMFRGDFPTEFYIEIYDFDRNFVQSYTKYINQDFIEMDIYLPDAPSFYLVVYGVGFSAMYDLEISINNDGGDDNQTTSADGGSDGGGAPDNPLAIDGFPLMATGFISIGMLAIVISVINRKRRTGF